VASPVARLLALAEHLEVGDRGTADLDHQRERFVEQGFDVVLA